MCSGPGNAAPAALKAVPPWECLHLLVRQATGWVCLECGAEEGIAPQAPTESELTKSERQDANARNREAGRVGEDPDYEGEDEHGQD